MNDSSRIGKINNQSCVLLISISNIKFPVTADVLFSIFNKFGEVLRIIVFEKS